MIPLHPSVSPPDSVLQQVAGETAAHFLRPGAVRLSALPPLSLYVHYPWCVRKCPYCDFNSHTLQEDAESRYLDALRADLEAALPLIWGRKVYTVFVGGGTPSLLSAAGLERLISDIRALLPLEGQVEWTLEANPGTFEQERFAAYRASGINRLSIGVQSFNARHLQALGRIHTEQEAHTAIEAAMRLFDQVNLDLMFALPQQTLAESRQDVQRALSYAPQHLSLYHLTIEPNTLFAKFPPQIPNDELSADMHSMIGELLAGAGYQHYEVSAYAQPDCMARHNLNYWQFGDYLGIGAGAHSKLSFPHRVVRQVRHRHPRAYMEGALAGAAVQTSDEVARTELAFEFMLNALRLNEGFPATLLQERTGLSLHELAAQLDEAERRGLLQRDHRWIQPTALGRQFLNDLQQIFL